MPKPQHARRLACWGFGLFAEYLIETKQENFCEENSLVFKY